MSNNKIEMHGSWLGSNTPRIILQVDEPRNGDCNTLPEKLVIRVMLVSENSGAYPLLQFPSASGVQTHHDSNRLPMFFDACDGNPDMMGAFTVEVPDFGFGDPMDDYLKNRDFDPDHDFGTW